MNSQKVVEQLRAREPLFHHRELVFSRESFDAETADDFWEVGAYGKVYSRDQVRAEIIRRLAAEPEDALVSEGWTTEDHRVRELADDTYLFTYVLRGQGRVTRRATIWCCTPHRKWHVLYHQGTVVSDT
jgi:hypothetical protein